MLTSVKNEQMPIILDETQAALETTEDTFLEGRLTVRQPLRGARATIDALFLAASVPISDDKTTNIFEAGTGSGIVSLSIATRHPQAQLTTIDVEPVMCALARENAKKNNFADRIHVVEGDVTQPLSQNEFLSERMASYNHVLANPPFNLESRGRPSPDELKTRAHRTTPGALEDWIRFLTAMAAPHGTITLIHSPDELTTLLTCLDGRFGNLALFPLFPHSGKPAKRIIISGVKGSKAPNQLLPGIVLHTSDGKYTEDAESVLRKGTPLDLRISAGHT